MAASATDSMTSLTALAEQETTEAVWATKYLAQGDASGRDILRLFTVVPVEFVSGESAMA